MKKLLDPLCKLNFGARLPSISANSFVIGEVRDIRKFSKRRRRPRVRKLSIASLKRRTVSNGRF